MLRGYRSDLGGVGFTTNLRIGLLTTEKEAKRVFYGPEEKWKVCASGMQLSGGAGQHVLRGFCQTDRRSRATAGMRNVAPAKWQALQNKR